MIAPRESLLTMRVDWRAYYKLFCQQHGKPISYRGVQLFRDGWTYALNDYAGPEWPPPESPEEQRALVYAYWFVRRKQVAQLLLTLRQRVEGLRSLQAAKSVPVQVVHTLWNDERNTNERVIRDLDLSVFDGQLADLEADLQECEEQVSNLERTNAIR